MNFEQLQYAVTIAECGNITKAAEKLFVSQSALTKSMNRLESELGVRIFDRLQTPIRLTSAGEFFIAETQKILSQKNSLEKELSEFMDFKKGRIIVGMGPSRCDHWLPHILSRFWKLYPKVEVRVETGGKEFLEQELLNRELDVALITLSDQTLDTLDYEVVGRERLLFAIPPDHPILKGVEIPENSFENPVVLSAEALNGVHMLVAPKGYAITMMLQDVLRRYHISIGETTVLPSIDVAYSLAAEGMGVAYVFETCAYTGYYKEPVFATIGQIPRSIDIAVATRAGEPVPFLVDAFVRTVRDAVQNNPYLNYFRAR